MREKKAAQPLSLVRATMVPISSAKEEARGVDGSHEDCVDTILEML